MSRRKSKTEEMAKRQPKKKTNPILIVLFYVVFLGVPIYIANFTSWGDEFLMGVGLRVIVPLVIAVVITKVMYDKHFSVFENDEADHYLKKDRSEVTYRYDKFSHTH